MTDELKELQLEIRRAKMKRFRSIESNRVKINEYKRKDYAKNKARIKVQLKKSYLKYKPIRAQYAKEYLQKNKRVITPEQKKRHDESFALWLVKNKKYREYQHRQKNRTSIWVPLPVVKENYVQLIEIENERYGGKL